jgi:hypothetical protein
MMDEVIDKTDFEKNQCLKRFKDAKMNKNLIYTEIQTSDG